MNVIAACKLLGLMLLLFAGEMGLASAERRGTVRAAAGTPAS